MLHKLSAVELRDLFLKGEKSAVEIITYFLDRIDQNNPDLNAFLQVFHKKALDNANNLDKRKKEGKKLGKLAAIPIALKDNMHLLGEKTTCGSKILENYKAVFDATVTKLIEDEDGIIIGKTNMDEFAMGSSNENSAFGNVSNPWDLEKVPGGSSGGSAAAVAARLCPIALGSDTGGSIRQPASFCGIVGYKPTYGRVSRYGVVAFGSSFDQIGPITTNVEDAGLMMEVLGKHCEKDSTSLKLPQENYFPDDIEKTSFKGKKIGVPYKFLKNLDEKSFKNFEKSIEIVKNLGADVIDIDLDILKHSIAAYYILATAEASTNLARFDGIRYGLRSKEAKSLDEVYDFSRDEGFGPEVKRRIMLGTYVLSAGYQDAFYKKAQKVRTLIIDAFAKAFSNCDLIIMPTSPGSAFKIDGIQDIITMYMQDLFTIPASLAGLPSISIPNGFDEDNNNMPMGLQIIGPQMLDVAVIRHSNILEKALKLEKFPKKYL
jgi:aspartyl-tRNA(Asn)/glutamyl-tRNA(Gln) amidotransferase subunit A